MQLRAFALLALLVAASWPASSAPAAADWRARADQALVDAYDHGPEGLLSVMVQGPAIPAPAPPPATRADWTAAWDQQAAPFLAQLRIHAARLGGEVTSTIPAVNAAHVRVARALVPDLLGMPEIRRAGLDWLGATQVYADGPGTQATLGDAGAKTQAPDLWSLGFRGEDVKLAMIDTGIRESHEMFKNADGSSRVVAWQDVTTGNCATPCDTDGHGSHTASTAAGSNLFNSGSPQGIAPRASIIGVRIFVGSGGTWEDAQQGLQAAFDLGAEVSSNSWGGSCGGDATVTAELADTLTDAGMISVFAAGNNGFAVICPGIVDHLVTVAATDINENIASFSNPGPCTWKNVTRVCPDVAAVGVDLVAASISCDTCYVSNSGTSMATPQVAGVVALVQQARKAATGQGLDAPHAEADVLLRWSAKDLGTAGPDNNYGWGFVQGKAAVDLMSGQVPVDVRDRFSLGRTALRAYQTNPVALHVANLGSVPVAGAITLTIEQTDGAPCPAACERVQQVQAAALAPLREAVASYDFVGSAHPAGAYSVTARFDYTYNDPGDGQTRSGVLERTGNFLLKKVQFTTARAVPGLVHSGDAVFASLSLVNVGNENASNVAFTERFDYLGLVPVPMAPPGAPPFGVLANPAPSSINVFLSSPRVLIEKWTIGGVQSGSGWTAAYNFAGGQPGAYAFDGTLEYTDETGRPFTEVVRQGYVVALPG